RAVGLAAVAIDGIAVVAGLSGIEDVVAARRQRAVGLAGVAVHGVAVVAVLARIDGAVAARRRARAIRRARADACARGDAVALLRRLIDDVVAALRIDE